MNSRIDFRSPRTGLDEPVEIWLACHERVRRFTLLMGRLAEHLGKSGLNEDAKVTATSIRRYFNEAASRHHEDEEVDMFPLLRERVAADPNPTVCEVIDQVEADHLEMAGMWKMLDAALADVERGKRAELDVSLVERFTTLYQHHIDAEERVLLPAMQRVFGKGDWRAIGRAMSERRGLV